MKTLNKIALVITIIALFASFQSKIDVKKILSNTEIRKEIIDSIAASSSMSKEMMSALMNQKNGKMMMEHHKMMMNMMKENPAMMKSMMESKGDSGMICPMCGKKMEKNEMPGMMKKMPAEVKGNTSEKKDVKP